MKNIIGFSRDHSGSMRSLAHLARQDYNEQLRKIKAAALAQNQETLITTVTIGVGSRPVVGLECENTPIESVREITSYPADAAGTPMIESVFELIHRMSAAPGANDPDTSLLVMITTDGQETERRDRGRELASLIQRLQATDRWTFVFRVPKREGVREMTRLGLMVPGVNVYEWDTTEKGIKASTQANAEAFTEYFTARASGMKRTSKFYANAADVSIEDAKKELVDISNQVQFFDVLSKDDQSLIRPFVEHITGNPMIRGAAFYQLCKTEPKVQANKRIAIQDKNTGTVFAGDAARHMLALPTVGTVRLAPDDLGDWNVFIQSTSVNRKLDAGTKLMYWPAVGKAFKEGPSAR